MNPRSDPLQLVLARVALREAGKKLFICATDPLKSENEWLELFAQYLAAGEYVEALKRTGVN